MTDDGIDATLGVLRATGHRLARRAHRRPRGRVRRRQDARSRSSRSCRALHERAPGPGRARPPGSPTRRSTRSAAALPRRCVDDVARAATLGPLPTPRGTVAVVVRRHLGRPGRGRGGADRAGARRRGRAGRRRRRRRAAPAAGRPRRLAAADCLVVVAGMEGALPSVVGGLVGVPLVAVPTSVGYGASFGGLAALLAMLNSCAPGVTRGQHRQRVRRRRLRRPGGPQRRAAATRRVIGWVDASSGRQRRHAARRAARRRRPARGARPAPSTRSPPSTSRSPPSRSRRDGFAATRCHVEVADSSTHRGPGATSRRCSRRPSWPTPVRGARPRRLRAAGRGRGRGARHAPERRALPRGRRARRDRRRGRGLRRVRAPRRSTRLVVSPVAVGSGPGPRQRTASCRCRRRPSPSCCAASPSYAGPGDRRAVHARPGPRCSPRSPRRAAPQPAMTVAAIGVGAGGRDPASHANVLRLLVGDAGAAGASRDGRVRWSSRPTSTTSTRGCGPT